MRETLKARLAEIERATAGLTGLPWGMYCAPYLEPGGNVLLFPFRHHGRDGGKDITLQARTRSHSAHLPVMRWDRGRCCYVAERLDALPTWTREVGYTQQVLPMTYTRAADCIGMMFKRAVSRSELATLACLESAALRYGEETGHYVHWDVMKTNVMLRGETAVFTDCIAARRIYE